MSKEQFDRERLYQATLAVARTMLARGIITEDDYCKFDTILLAKYRPILGSLQAGKAHENLDK
jgi:hypothetical protein